MMWIEIAATRAAARPNYATTILGSQIMGILGLAPEAAAKSAFPQHFDIQAVIRPNILALQPYRCARDDYKTGVLLDANENALGHSIPPSAQSTMDEFLDTDLHRYPDPSHDEVKDRMARLRNIPGPQYIFLGVGSDEVIDLLMRVCCTPGKDKILITPPTYGMYTVCAHVNDVQIVKAPLDIAGGVFQPQIDHVSIPCIPIAPKCPSTILWTLFTGSSRVLKRFTRQFRPMHQLNSFFFAPRGILLGR